MLVRRRSVLVSSHKKHTEEKEDKKSRENSHGSSYELELKNDLISHLLTSPKPLFSVRARHRPKIPSLSERLQRLERGGRAVERRGLRLEIRFDEVVLKLTVESHLDGKSKPRVSSDAKHWIRRTRLTRGRTSMSYSSSWGMKGSFAGGI